MQRLSAAGVSGFVEPTTGRGAPRSRRLKAPTAGGRFRTVTGAQNLRRTPLHEVHVELGARLVPFAGWEMPVQYEGIVKEHQAVRRAAGLFDVSHMGELVLEGDAALATVGGLVTNRVERLEDGQALYTVCCNEQGGILDDLIVYRVTSTKVMVVCNASNRDKIAAHFAAHARGRCELRDASDDLALIALQGPAAADVATAAGAPGLRALGSFHLAEATVAGVTCTAARTGYTGEDGFELFCSAGDGARLLRGLLAAGADAGVAPVGLGARDTLRLEACLSLYGNDIDESTNPYEAGLGWVVKLKGRDFLGRDALAAIKADGVERKLVGFVMTGRGIGRHGYPIVDASGAEVGAVTSGSPGPTVGQNIGLGYVPVDMASVGTELGILIRGKVVAARVAETPFYKRDK